MPDKCCVPGCQSNYDSKKHLGYTTVFKFPSDDALRQRWIKSIPRDNWTPSKHAVVCIKHFEEADLSRVEQYKDKEGVEREYPRNRPILLHDALPRLFPSLPSYLSNPQPQKRVDPEGRQKRCVDVNERKHQEWLEGDKILNFSDLCGNFSTKLLVVKKWKIEIVTGAMFFYTINFSNKPFIENSIKISDDMVVQVCVGNSLILKDDLLWILPHSLKLERWSQLENILIRYVYQTFSPSVNELITKTNEDITALKDALDDTTMTKSLMFLLEQIQLKINKKKLYTLDMILNAFLIFEQSASCYQAVRLNGLLTLPHPKNMQQLISSCCISPTSESCNKHFLKFLVNKLQAKDRFVVLQIDEIYVNPGVAYKGGKLIGYAENNVSEAAKTVVAFMVSSPFGNFKEVVSLIPVKGLTGVELHRLTVNTMQLIRNCGLQIISLICDNNRINRTMYNLFCKGSTDEFSFSVDDSKIYMLYDTVHIFKNIRNNWINLRDVDKTMYFPDFELDDPSAPLLAAKFSDLVLLYKKESNQIIKSAPKLSFKTMYPTNIERQNVNLVNNIFHETTLASLENEYGLNSGTTTFVRIIYMWWNVVNIKTPLKGTVKRNELCHPFIDSADARLMFLEKFLNWMMRWRSLDLQAGSLTKDTHNALYQSTSLLKQIIVYAIDKLGVDYVLTGKFQTDNLEHRFSCYRQLSGGNYNVSVLQVYESEKKMRMKSLLGLHSAKYGEVKFCADIFIGDAVCEQSHVHNLDATDFLPIVNRCHVDSGKIDESSLLFVCGYAVHKLVPKLNCSSCISLVRSECTDDFYFQRLNRGGLNIPSELVVELGVQVYYIMQQLISKEYEEKFLSCQQQQKLIIYLALEYVSTDPSLRVDFTGNCLCGTDLHKVLISIVTTLSNVLLNNYSKFMKDKLCAKKTTSKKRKLATVQ